MAILVLPFLVYFIWVYNSKENFFKTLEYVGPPQIQKMLTEDGEMVKDTKFFQNPGVCGTSPNSKGAN